MSQLLPHQQRVVTELEELNSKLVKLNNFIDENNMFKELDQAEQGRLTRQAKYMKQYSDVLLERVSAFNKTEAQAVSDAARKGFNDK